MFGFAQPHHAHQPSAHHTHQTYAQPMGYFPVNQMWPAHSYSGGHRFNIPFLPIMGHQSIGQFLQNIYQSIVDEATAAEFYSRLLKEAPDELHRDFIQHAHDDELEHLRAFTQLYVHFTGQEPQYRIEPVQYRTYKEGILKALKDELEAAEFYRDVQLSSTDPLVRDTFFMAMVDELEHSTQFGVLYNTL